MASWWRLIEELVKKFLSSLWINQHHTGIDALLAWVRMKSAHQIETLSFQVARHKFFNWSFGFMIKMLIKIYIFYNFQRALEMNFELQRAHSRQAVGVSICNPFKKTIKNDA